MRVELPRLRRQWEALAAELPRARGAYVLELHLRRPRWLSVGSLGQVRVPAGRLRYYGSARGPGGLRGRVARHLRTAARPRDARCHWHIDALLTSEARLYALELVVGASDLQGHAPASADAEHRLVARDLRAGWVAAVPGFGASDCERCPAHLLARDH